MGFLDYFKFEDLTSERKSQLQHSIEELLPGLNEKTYIGYTCIAGLMARVASVDMVIDEREREFMIEALLEWTDLNEDNAKAITEIALNNVKTLASLESHLYCSPLVDNYSRENRFSIVRVLFQLSASDDEVINAESEEIRTITKALNLTHEHFISARAEVADKLKALKS
ncbi:MAG: TerB family tellurite resistance protein [Halobacteriovoraceae bacterium]|nr:TerB family tellurite resistance protein [Halobacteriovoraceae bacterium]MCB9095237.1 TerB family tellurite resistance protein [Halobacteriovoraceae bacterium]